MAYTIAYNAFHAGTGDIDRAETFAGKIVVAARRSGDTALENVGLIAQYEIACECGEDASAGHLRRRIDSLALPEQYAERFARGVGDVILAAISNDLPAFYANAVLLRDALATDRSMLALAAALRSLGAAALGDFEDARRSSRNALGLAALTDGPEPAYSVRYRRLARTLAAATCILIGDEVRARRSTARHVARDTHGLMLLLTIAQGADPHQTPRRIRGYARVISIVRDAITSSFRRSVLSEAEYTVLTLLASGMSAPQIAAQTGRSVHTIRAHTRAIIEKFGVRGRSAAIAYAHANGLLTQAP
jgi:DNA-binding CsgD family transcriptional regulator